MNDDFGVFAVPGRMDGLIDESLVWPDVPDDCDELTVHLVRLLVLNRERVAVSPESVLAMSDAEKRAVLADANRTLGIQPLFSLAEGK